MTNNPVIVTHNGGFHADDCFAVAVLLLYLEKEPDEVEIVRTRDPEAIENGDFVVDVGMEYDPVLKRFDHHQEGGAGRRENGIPYASFGLVWKEYGNPVAGSESISKAIDRKLVSFVDAEDVGVSVVEPKIDDVSIYTIQRVVGSFDPGLGASEAELQKAFVRVVGFAKEVLGNELRLALQEEGMHSAVVEAYQGSPDKSLIVLEGAKGWSRILISQILSEFPEPVYFVRERRDHGWQVVCVGHERYVNRKDMPQDWAGKKDEELQKITGVEDALFCHNGRFMCVSKTKEGAIALAKLALSS